MMRLCSEMPYALLMRFIIPKIFISYDFNVISSRKSCGNGLISLTVDMSPLCPETCNAQRRYVQSYFQFLAFISYYSRVNSYANAVSRWSGIFSYNRSSESCE